MPYHPTHINTSINKSGNSTDRGYDMLAEEFLATIIAPNIPYIDLAPSDAVVPGYRVDLFKTQ